MTQADIPSILKKIIITKHAEIAALKEQRSLDSVKNDAIHLSKSGTSPRRGFAQALRDKQKTKTPSIIAEIKKASPSKGIIAANFDPIKSAIDYEQAGAACLSVLTDEQYFQGHARYLNAAREACKLPALRKDFMIEPYQIYESYLMGADCILLIVACLDDATLHNLHRISVNLGLDVLIEVHTEQEFERALKLPYSNANIYGINNRDLNTFNTDLNTSIKLKDMLDKANLSESVTGDSSSTAPLLVTESGIHSSSDMQLMLDNGIDCFLIGEQFMKTEHPGETLASLLNSIPASKND